MKDESLLSEAGLFDENGRLFTPGPVNTWFRPESVLPTLCAATGSNRDGGADECLVISEYKTGTAPKVRPAADLLERFINLSEAPMSRIAKFAASHGRIGIYAPPVYFGQIARKGPVEYCEVWRWFARSMHSLLKISASVLSGQQASKVDWGKIEDVPLVVKHMDHDQLSKSEMMWRSQAMLGIFKYPSTRKELETRLNTLLALGEVRPWVQWPDTTNQPSLVYNSPGLLPHLTLQLCLRVLRRETFVLCCHCSGEFAPVKRAPKAGQRSFCPECRQAKVPQRYAKQDYRNRERN